MATAAVIGLGNMGREHKAAYIDEGLDYRRNPRKTDFLSICTPDHCHAPDVIKGLRRGQKVFSEKPVCTTSTDFKAIRDLAIPDRLGCNFPLRFTKKFQRLKRLIEMDGFGEVYYVQGTYHWGRREKLQTTWRRDDDYSFMLGGGIHMIDLVKFLFPGEMKALGPSLRNSAVQVGALRINSGVLCQIVADFGSNRGDHWHRIEIRGTKSHLSVTNHAPTDKTAALRAFIHGKGSPTTVEILQVMECALILARK